MMKGGLDLSRIHWINRHLLPHYTPFHWSKNDSRFLEVFYALSEEQRGPCHFDAPLKQLTSPYPVLPLSSSHSEEINVLKILLQEDKRTTLMNRNTPIKFTKNDFLSLFNVQFRLVLFTHLRQRKQELRLCLHQLH